MYHCVYVYVYIKIVYVCSYSSEVDRRHAHSVAELVLKFHHIKRTWISSIQRWNDIL